jgi:hypothetical protein
MSIGLAGNVEQRLAVGFGFALAVDMQQPQCKRKMNSTLVMSSSFFSLVLAASASAHAAPRVTVAPAMPDAANASSPSATVLVPLFSDDWRQTQTAIDSAIANSKTGKSGAAVIVYATTTLKYACLCPPFAFPGAEGMGQDLYVWPKPGKGISQIPALQSQLGAMRLLGHFKGKRLSGYEVAGTKPSAWTGEGDPAPDPMTTKAPVFTVEGWCFEPEATISQSDAKQFGAQLQTLAAQGRFCSGTKYPTTLRAEPVAVASAPVVAVTSLPPSPLSADAAKASVAPLLIPQYSDDITALKNLVSNEIANSKRGQAGGATAIYVKSTSDYGCECPDFTLTALYNTGQDVFVWPNYGKDIPTIPVVGARTGNVRLLGHFKGRLMDGYEVAGKNPTKEERNQGARNRMLTKGAAFTVEGWCFDPSPTISQTDEKSYGQALQNMQAAGRFCTTKQYPQRLRD